MMYSFDISDSSQVFVMMLCNMHTREMLSAAEAEAEAAKLCWLGLKSSPVAWV